MAGGVPVSDQIAELAEDAPLSRTLTGREIHAARHVRMVTVSGREGEPAGRQTGAARRGGMYLPAATRLARAPALGR